MSHDPNAGAVPGEGFSRRRFLTSLGLLTLAATVGSSLVAPDEAEAGKKSKKRNHGRKVSKVARNKKHSGKKHGKKVSRVARKKRKK